MYSNNKIKKGNKQKNPKHARVPRKTEDSRGETQMIWTGPYILGTDWGGDKSERSSTDQSDKEEGKTKA